MKSAEYNQIAAYLRQAEQSKYSYHDIKARFEAEPAAVYGTDMARWIPDLAYAHQLRPGSIALALPANGMGLELGAGSGQIQRCFLPALSKLSISVIRAPRVSGRLALSIPR